jgi:SNF2 family DNA or RNA helicase
MTAHHLFGHKLIPNAPHVIVVPTTLLAFWEQEVRTWLGSNVDILTYEGKLSKHNNDFSDNGMFRRSVVEPYRRIILVTTSVRVLKTERYQT